MMLREIKSYFSQIVLYFTKVANKPCSNFILLKIKEKSPDTEVSGLLFMVTRTGIEPMLPP